MTSTLYRNRHPAVDRLLNQLEDLRASAEQRANTIIAPVYAGESEEDRILRQSCARATADAYAFCQMLLRDIEI